MINVPFQNVGLYVSNLLGCFNYSIYLISYFHFFIVQCGQFLYYEKSPQQIIWIFLVVRNKKEKKRVTKILNIKPFH